MARKYQVRCECGRDVEFSMVDVPALADEIRRKVEEAHAEGHDEGEESAAESAAADTLHLLNGRGRRLFELAAAIRRGDRQEAEIHLDRISEELGPKAQEMVQQGRYSLKAKENANG